MSAASKVLVGGGFDDIRSRDIRFLEEASKLGALSVLLWHDDARAWRQPPKFDFAERAYILNAVRFVHRVIGVHDEDVFRGGADIWAEREADATARREAVVREQGLHYEVIPESRLDGFPEPAESPASGRKKIVVTGCFDWLHSGHVRFFEEAATYGDLVVFIGNDACVTELKGSGHPLFGQWERRYVVGAIRYVRSAQVSSGRGWLDAEAEIRALKPDIFIVNEDGDKACKRDWCRELGIDYRVLKRLPAEGLPWRSSTDLRGY